MNTTKPVTQEWLNGLSFMQQTVLLCAVRGPDGYPKYGPPKYLLRWYRRCILVSSLEGGHVHRNPIEPGGGSFMGASIDRHAGITVKNWEAPMDDLASQYVRGLDAIPHHYQLHFLHAVEIVGYKHPDERIRAWWNSLYRRLVADMHLYPESCEQMDSRLGDDESGWLERCDKAVQG